MAVTNIPWGDGSGDYIHFTYSAASGDQTVLVSSDANGTYEERTKNITFSAYGASSVVLTVKQSANDIVSITYNDTCITRNDVAIGYKPYDAQVKYIESSGTQLLDTGISGGTNAEYSLLFEICDGNTGWAQYFGCSRNEECAPKLYRWDSSPYQGMTYGEWSAPSAYTLQIGYLPTDTKILCEFKGGEFSLDGTMLANPGNLGFGSNSFCIFGYKPEIDYKSKLRLYACKVWLDGTLVRDMIPVRVSGVGYMFDRVSDTLIGNSGTGSFILGADVN